VVRSGSSCIGPIVAEGLAGVSSHLISHQILTQNAPSVVEIG
jgi:hypothetical protein